MYGCANNKDDLIIHMIVREKKRERTIPISRSYIIFSSKLIITMNAMQCGCS